MAVLTHDHPEQVPQPGGPAEPGHQHGVDGDAEERQEGQAGNLQGAVNSTAKFSFLLLWLGKGKPSLAVRHRDPSWDCSLCWRGMLVEGALIGSSWHCCRRYCWI